MATTLTTIPAARSQKVYDTPADLPQGRFYCAPDAVEGYHGDGEYGHTSAGAASRDQFQRHGVRLGLLDSDSNEVDRVFTHEPADYARGYLASHPGAKFGLLVGAELRDSETGASTIIA